jgi:glycosyltransferase involved in cell wall biosynthesis
LDRPSILFVHNDLTPFVEIDRDLLGRRWTLREWVQRSRLVNLGKLVRAVHGCDLVFGWFASWHTFWPIYIAKVLGKPSILVVGGYDVAKLGDIGYGQATKRFRKWITRQTILTASTVTTFSKFSRSEVERNLGIQTDRVQVIYLGVPDRWAHLKRDKSMTVLSVGNIDCDNLQRKGLLAFVRAAALLPDVRFVLAGAWRDGSIGKLRLLASPNVLLPGYIDRNSLDDCFSAASVYVQASKHEGFGMAVGEAMLARCIPVVSSAGSLPEVVGSVGVYLSTTEPEEIADKVKRALTLQDVARESARQRILDTFPLERRATAMTALVESAAMGGKR